MPVLHTFLSFPDGVFQKLSDEVLEDLLCMDAEGFVYCIDGCGIVQLLCIDRASASADAKGFAVLAFFLEDRAQMIPVIDFRILPTTRFSSSMDPMKCSLFSMAPWQMPTWPSGVMTI